MLLIQLCRSSRQQWFHKIMQPYRLLSLSASSPYLDLTPEDLVKLPLARFSGDCILISTPEDEYIYSSAIRSLFKQEVLGFDTEWYNRRRWPKPALVQIASEDICILWRLRYQGQERRFVGTDFPPELFDLLRTRTIVKAGHNSGLDAYLLLKHYYVNSYSIFDTHRLSTQLELPMQSLRGLAGVLLGLQLSKGQTQTNWEKRYLSDSQLRYASTDAWMSLKVYQALMKYAAAQGVIPAPPARTAFEFVSTNERKYIGRIMEKKGLKEQKDTSTVKRTLKESQCSTARQEAEMRAAAEKHRPMGILERVRDVINRFLSEIKQTKESILPHSSPFSQSGSGENPNSTECTTHNSNRNKSTCSDSSDKGATQCSSSLVDSTSTEREGENSEVTSWSLDGRKVDYNPLHSREHYDIDTPHVGQPVASVAHCSHTEQGRSVSAFREKIATMELCRLDGNETNPVYIVGEASKAKEESRDWMTAAVCEDGVVLKRNLMSEQSKYDSKCTDEVESATSLLNLQVNSSDGQT